MNGIQIHETNWFGACYPRWEHQAVEFIVLDPQYTKTKGKIHEGVVKAIRVYLQSLGFEEEKRFTLSGKHEVFLIDLVNKQFRLAVSSRDNKEFYRALPSQIPEFLVKKRGFLTGKKFGI